MKDLRTLCDEAIQLWDADCDMDGVINEMRAHLAQPEPKRPTVMEIIALADEVEAEGLGQVDLVRRALARWGRPAIEPVPVEERLPGPEDCDEEDECYWFDPAGAGAWYLDTYQGNYTHWLPHHALPVPAPSSEEN